MKRAYFFVVGALLVIKYAMQDHNDAAYNAKLRSWPGLAVGNCYPHASRMVTRATRRRLRNEDHAQPLRDGFRNLQALTITPVFEHAVMLWYLNWERREPDFVRWFRENYDRNGRWLGWFAGTLGFDF